MKWYNKDITYKEMRKFNFGVTKKLQNSCKIKLVHYIIITFKFLKNKNDSGTLCNRKNTYVS